MAALEVVPATWGHAQALAPNLRAADLAEVQAAGYEGGLEALVDSLLCSDVAYAALVDGEVAGLFGVSHGTPKPRRVGVVWFLSGPAFARHPRPFARIGRRVVAVLLEEYEALGNLVDARYLVALRWVEWLGFRLGVPQPHGPQGLAFVPAFIERG